MILKKIKQLKLSTGEEIICEIVEEDDNDLIVRNPLAIIFQNGEDGFRMWSFRLFMCYQDDPDKLILLKIDKIVAIANPAKLIIEQYISGVDSIMDISYEDDYDEDDIEYGDDSGFNNVLPFPTLH